MGPAVDMVRLRDFGLSTCVVNGCTVASDLPIPVPHQAVAQLAERSIPWQDIRFGLIYVLGYGTAGRHKDTYLGLLSALSPGFAAEARREAEVSFDRGQPEWARLILRVALQYDPTSTQLLHALTQTCFRLAWECVRLGQPDHRAQLLREAVEAGRHWIRIAPGDPDAHLSLGHVLAELGQTKEAIALLQRALALGVSQPNAEEAKRVISLLSGPRPPMPPSVTPNLPPALQTLWLTPSLEHKFCFAFCGRERLPGGDRCSDCEVHLVPESLGTQVLSSDGTYRAFLVWLTTRRVGHDQLIRELLCALAARLAPPQLELLRTVAAHYGVTTSLKHRKCYVCGRRVSYLALISGDEALIDCIPNPDGNGSVCFGCVDTFMTTHNRMSHHAADAHSMRESIKRVNAEAGRLRDLIRQHQDESARTLAVAMRVSDLMDDLTGLREKLHVADAAFRAARQELQAMGWHENCGETQAETAARRARKSAAEVADGGDADGS